VRVTLLLPDGCTNAMVGREQWEQPGGEDSSWDRSRAAARRSPDTQALAQRAPIRAKPSRQPSSGLATSGTRDGQACFFKS